MREIKIKINNQLKIEELNNIRKKFKLPQIDYTKGITLKEVICYIQQVKESIKNHINRADYIHNKERLIELLDYENTGIEWQMKYISYILESIQYYEEIYAELEDIILTKLLLKNESSIDTYFYNRGWIFSNRISAKDILSYIGSINKYKLKKLDAKSLDEIILLYFKNKKIDLCKIIKSWNKKEFNNRSHIFAECLWAINNKKYAIVIATLIIQIEGVLYDKFGKVVKENNRDWWKVKESLDYVFNKSDNYCKHLKLMLQEDVYAGFGKSYLDKSWKDNGYKTHTNRNEIVHGIDIKYNNEITLIKVIMILDAIHNIL